MFQICQIDFLLKSRISANLKFFDKGKKSFAI